MNLFAAERALRLLLFFAAAACSLSAQPASVTPTNEVRLFDGKSFSGWMFVSKDTNEPAASIWSVTNGVIVCQGRPNGYARTLQSYRDYQLHAEWCFPVSAGNSGVFLHINGPDKVWPLCLEAQLLSGSAGEVRCNGGSRVNELTRDFPRSVPRRQPSSEKPIGQWNSYDIVCRGNTVTIRVNGVLQNTVTGSSISAGSIGLQAEGQLIEFRSLVLEPLP